VRAGHVFISYSHDDAKRVDDVERALAFSDIPVWRDTENLRFGDDWPARIRQAIADDALVMIACFSSQSVARKTGYQYAELSLAVEQLRLRRPDVPWLIPVRFDDCVIPDFDIGGGRTLGNLHRADLFGAQADAQLARLVQTVGRILDQQPDAFLPIPPSGPEVTGADALGPSPPVDSRSPIGSPMDNTMGLKEALLHDPSDSPGTATGSAPTPPATTTTPPTGMTPTDKTSQNNRIRHWIRIYQVSRALTFFMAALATVSAFLWIAPSLNAVFKPGRPAGEQFLPLLLSLGVLAAVPLSLFGALHDLFGAFSDRDENPENSRRKWVTLLGVTLNILLVAALLLVTVYATAHITW
jgi:hypothetical protein